MSFGIGIPSRRRYWQGDKFHLKPLQNMMTSLFIPRFEVKSPHLNLLSMRLNKRDPMVGYRAYMGKIIISQVGLVNGCTPVKPRKRGDSLK